MNFLSKMLSGETLCKLLQIFPPGKLRDVTYRVVMKPKKKKGIMAHAYFGRLYFLKFFGGKNNFLTVVIRGKTSRKKKDS